MPPPAASYSPAGTIATLTNTTLGGCNANSWGYTLTGVTQGAQDSKPSGCFSKVTPDLTIGPFTLDQVLNVYLADGTCGTTYYSDGTPVDHVIVDGSSPYTLRFADGGGFCELASTVADTFTGFNFETTLNLRDTKPVPSFTTSSQTGSIADAGRMRFDATSSTDPTDQIVEYDWKWVMAARTRRRSRSPSTPMQPRATTQRLSPRQTGRAPKRQSHSRSRSLNVTVRRRSR